MITFFNAPGDAGDPFSEPSFNVAAGSSTFI
jgi:hypothetical protein